MDADIIHKKDRLRAEYSASELVVELMERGALRGYGATEYLPHSVTSRAQHDLTSYATAKLTKSITEHVARAGVTSFTQTTAQQRGYEDAHPEDVIIEAMLLTLDPDYELEDM